MIGLGLNINQLVGRTTAPTESLRDQVIAALFGDGEQGIFIDPADDGLMFQSRTSATTPAGDSDPVGTAVGAEGLDSMIAPNDAARPARDFTDGVWGLRGDGIDDQINTGADYAIEVPWYFAVAYKPIGASFHTVFNLGRDGSNYFLIRSRNSTTNSVLTQTRGGIESIATESIDGPENSAPIGDWVVVELLVEAGRTRVWVGGDEIADESNSWGASDSIDISFLGVFNRGGLVNTGELVHGAAIAVNRAPNSAERQLILDLMAERGYM